MHELSIAQSLLDIVLEEAAKHGVSRVTKVVVKVGKFTGVVPSALTFSFDMIKEDTMAAEAVLDIEEVPLMGVCHACGADLDMAEPVFACTACGSDDIKVTQGQELYIDHLEAD